MMKLDKTVSDRNESGSVNLKKSMASNCFYKSYNTTIKNEQILEEKNIESINSDMTKKDKRRTNSIDYSPIIQNYNDSTNNNILNKTNNSKNFRRENKKNKTAVSWMKIDLTKYKGFSLTNNNNQYYNNNNNNNNKNNSSGSQFVQEEIKRKNTSERFVGKLNSDNSKFYTPGRQKITNKTSFTGQNKIVWFNLDRKTFDQ